PLIGIFIMVVWGVADLAHQVLASSSNARATLVALSAATGVALLIGTSLQLQHWKNTRTLFEHAAAVTQNNDRAAAVLGNLAVADGKLDEAKRLYALALSYNSDSPETHFHMARLLDKQGDLDGALAEYSKALWARQWQEQAHIAMGVALAKKARFD